MSSSSKLRAIFGEFRRKATDKISEKSMVAGMCSLDSKGGKIGRLMGDLDVEETWEGVVIAAAFFRIAASFRLSFLCLGKMTSPATFHVLYAPQFSLSRVYSYASSTTNYYRQVTRNITDQTGDSHGM